MCSKEITASLEIVTPMFLGGAKTSDIADAIRPPSIKGALRFWWRALQWSRVCHGDSDADKRAALRQLHQDEGWLFGTAADGDNSHQSRGHQSRVLIRSGLERGATVNDWPLNNTDSGYLGLGLFESGRKDKGNYAPHRVGFQPSQTFSVSLRLRPGTSDEDAASIREAFTAWGTLGGLGSRGQRRGFGSVALRQLDGEPIRFDSPGDYLDHVGRLVATAEEVSGRPPYSALSRHTRVALLSQSSDPLDAHAKMGHAFKQHRGPPSDLRGRAKLPFGLPLAGVDDQRRRASPLLFHVHPAGDAYLGVVLFMPAFFHPDYPDVDYSELESFLDSAAITTEPRR